MSEKPLSPLGTKQTEFAALAGGNFELSNGEVVRQLHPYGVGIDCHSKFIQVCVLVQQGPQVVQYEREFQTTWPELVKARDFAIQHAMLSGESADQFTLRYTIESTGTYHVPVLLAWRGVPAVVNPMLAGATRRKTDVLDARLLAHHSLCGLWRNSFIPTRDAEVLRVLVNMRFEAGRNATRALNRINNHILRFGHTLGRDHSMSDSYARAVIEDMCDGKVFHGENVCPDGIPSAAWPFFKTCYKWYDYFKDERETYHKSSVRYAKETLWPTHSGLIQGSELLENLQTVPGVGEVTALTWLSVIVDSKRFKKGDEVSAFCGADPSLKVSAGKVTSHKKRKGNARLHHVLKNVAAQLIRRRKEPFGIWGFSLSRRHAKGGWPRAINAISRRIAMSLWHVHRTGNPFSYEKYKLLEVPAVPVMKVEDMGLSTRYLNLLTEANCFTSEDVARMLHTSLPQTKGIGAGCLSALKKWVEENKLPTPQQSPTDSPLQEKSSGASERSLSTNKRRKHANA